MPRLASVGAAPPVQLPPVPKFALRGRCRPILCRRNRIADVQAGADRGRLRVDHEIAAGEKIRADDAVDDVGRIGRIEHVQNDDGNIREHQVAATHHGLNRKLLEKIARHVELDAAGTDYRDGEIGMVRVQPQSRLRVGIVLGDDSNIGACIKQELHSH